MRLTKKQIVDYKQKLAEWLPPAAIRTQASEIMDLIGNEDFFNQPDLDFVREAWVAGEFGEKRDAAAARLVNVNEARPDFALRLKGGEVELYELVEADRIDRERGAEYRALAAAGNPTYDWPVEEWATREQTRAADIA